MTPENGSFFNAHHSPVGAFASFTLGYQGAKGGLGLELGGPANESVFVGLEKSTGRGYEALPFFASSADSAKRYDVSAEVPLRQGMVREFDSGKIARSFGVGCDSWSAGDLIFSIYSAPKSVPDPLKARKAEMMSALVPAVFAEIVVDNTRSGRARKVFFGYEGSNPFYNMRLLDDVSGGRLAGVGQGPLTAIVSASPGIFSGMGFTLDQVLEPDHAENLAFGLGGVGALMSVVPARKKQRFQFAVCFHRDGVITSGLPARYFYTRYFPSIEDVADYALENWTAQKALAFEADARLSRSKLSPAQKFQLAHAVRSYYGATEFLATDAGEPFWTVNEGEYRMLNTFDPTLS